jgi:hypothetical protein
LEIVYSGGIVLNPSGFPASTAMLDAVFSGVLENLPGGWPGVGNVSSKHSSYSIAAPPVRIVAEAECARYGDDATWSGSETSNTITIERDGGTIHVTNSVSVTSHAMSQVYNTADIFAAGIVPAKACGTYIKRQKSGSASQSGGGATTTIHGPLAHTSVIVTGGINHTFSQQLTIGDTTSDVLSGVQWGSNSGAVVGYGAGNYLGFTDTALGTDNDGTVIGGNNYHAYSSESITLFNCRNHATATTFSATLGENYAPGGANPTYIIGTTG